jgi:hypothetical protein
MTEDFEAAAATTLAAMLKASIKRVFPHLSRCDSDAVFISVSTPWREPMASPSSPTADPTATTPKSSAHMR